MTTLVSSGEPLADEARNLENAEITVPLSARVAKLVQAPGWGALGPDAWAHNLNTRHTPDDRCSPHRDSRLVSPWGARSAGRSTGRIPEDALRVRGTIR